MPRKQQERADHAFAVCGAAIVRDDAPETAAPASAAGGGCPISNQPIGGADGALTCYPHIMQYLLISRKAADAWPPEKTLTP